MAEMGSVNLSMAVEKQKLKPGLMLKTCLSSWSQKKGLDAIVAFFIVVVFNNGPKKSQG